MNRMSWVGCLAMVGCAGAVQVDQPAQEGVGGAAHSASVGVYTQPLSSQSAAVSAVQSSASASSVAVSLSSAGVSSSAVGASSASASSVVAVASRLSSAASSGCPVGADGQRYGCDFVYVAWTRPKSEANGLWWDWFTDSACKAMVLPIHSWAPVQVCVWDSASPSVYPDGTPQTGDVIAVYNYTQHDLVGDDTTVWYYLEGGACKPWTGANPFAHGWEKIVAVTPTTMNNVPGGC